MIGKILTKILQINLVKDVYYHVGFGTYKVLF